MHAYARDYSPANAVKVKSTRQLEVEFVSRFALPEEYVEAEKALYRAIKAMDYQTPCFLEPDLFIEQHRPPKGHRESLAEFTVRAKKAWRLCHECAVFQQCGRLAASLSEREPEISGILAGRIFTHSTNKDTSALDKVHAILDKEMI